MKKIVKKTTVTAQSGKKIVGNPQGYNPSTSPLKTTPYEKKADTIGTGTNKTVRILSGKGKVISQEKLGTSSEKAMSKAHAREKAYTEDRRAKNLGFLKSRQTSGGTASRNIGTSTGKSPAKSGGTIKRKK